MQKSSKKINSIVVGLMDYLSETGSQELVSDIADSLTNLSDESKNAQEVVVTSVTTLAENQISELKKILSRLIKINLPIRNTQDKKLLGGLTIRVADWFLDASLSSELNDLKNKLIS